jgi:hypothetical protein
VSNQSANIMTPSQKLAAGVDKLSRSLASRVSALEDRFAKAFSGFSAGSVNTPNRDTGVAGVAVYGGSLYKGGSYILSSPSTIRDDMVAGETSEISFSAAVQQKISGTVVTRIGINPADLEPFANQLTVTLMINGEKVPTLKDVLLSNLLNTLDGEQRYAVPNLLVPYDATVSIVVTCIAPLGGAGTPLGGFAWLASEFRPGLA